MIPEQLNSIPDIKRYSIADRLWGYIYFIISENKVIYVGKTKNDINSRLIEFKKSRKRKYDEVYYIIRHPKDLDATELYYINEFQPEYNKHGKKSIGDKPSNS